ncbi:hypothetical protein HUJ04_007901 [Dendroctonus ponderosae]|nr:hypothetical protein HUJ04_007901 [Dendroctonus ponderosae]
MISCYTTTNYSSGEFLCWYTPVGQVLFNLASSLALLVIALDRYHNVIYALDKKWDPKLWICILGALVLWGLCFGKFCCANPASSSLTTLFPLAVSYPMINFYFYVPLRLPSGEDVNMCTGTSTSRNGIAYYYVIIDVLIFGPLVSMFFWFYYKIAILIWRHRKPLSLRTDTKIEEFENTSYTKGSSETSGGSNVKSQIIKKKRNVQMERKIRTFKIVIVLIVAFILCRMPYWVFWLLKLLTSIRSGDAVWRTIFIMTSLNLLNCALNPFLYTYLNQTIYVCRKINDFFWSTCCCCFSNAEFDDYERGTPIYEGVLGQVATTDQWKTPRNRPEVNPGYEKFPQVPHFPKYTSVNRY